MPSQNTLLALYVFSAEMQCSVVVFLTEIQSAHISFKDYLPLHICIHFDIVSRKPGRSPETCDGAAFFSPPPYDSEFNFGKCIREDVKGQFFWQWHLWQMGSKKCTWWGIQIIKTRAQGLWTGELCTKAQESVCMETGGLVCILRELIRKLQDRCGGKDQVIGMWWCRQWPSNLFALNLCPT